jgi:phospholipase C
MMENRSFDHMLGYLSKEGGRSDIDGLRGGEKNTYKGKTYFSSKLPDTVFEYSPCHEHECIDNQINGGKLDGFVADYAPRAEKVGVDPGLVMGYHNAAQVPVYDALAREFLICQRWFASHPGPTFPNRHYALTGRLNRDPYGSWEYDNPGSSTFVPTSAKNIFDHLTAQGIPWRYYEHGYCTLRLFERYTYDNVNIVDAGPDAGNFIADALAGSLPSVTFIDPDFINAPPGNDDQPPADITAGQRLIGRIADALIKSSDAWNNTLLIVTYDEHGGFFDHVPPPQAPAVSSIERYGVRVPAFVISPWVARGQVTDLVFDHTSILKTIIRCFLYARPPDLGERVTEANDLSMVLQPTRRSDRPSIPVPPWSHRNLRLARKAETATEGPRDFRELLRTVRSRSLVPR